MPYECPVDRVIATPGKCHTLPEVLLYNSLKILIKFGFSMRRPAACASMSVIVIATLHSKRDVCPVGCAALDI
jgi:hypothetical protein